MMYLLESLLLQRLIDPAEHRINTQHEKILAS